MTDSQFTQAQSFRTRKDETENKMDPPPSTPGSIFSFFAQGSFSCDRNGRLCSLHATRRRSDIGRKTYSNPEMQM